MASLASSLGLLALACSTPVEVLPDYGQRYDLRFIDTGPRVDGNTGTDGSPREDSTTDGSPREDSTTDGSPREDSTIDGTLPLQRFELPATTDLDLSAFLSNLTVDKNRPVTLVVPRGITIGATSTGKAAITSGDLSLYTSVTLEIAGEVRGAGGLPNGGRGGDALLLTSPLRLHIADTGHVRAGGGGGGRGGAGGIGNDDGTWSPWQYSETSPKYFWSPSWDEIEWNDVGGIAVGQMCCEYAFAGGLVYEKGRQRTNLPLPLLFEVRRATLHQGTPGAGGAGGGGRGFQNNDVGGSVGSRGSYRAGNGGRGGEGGDWGIEGDVGGNGAGGYAYSATTSLEAHSGLAGAAGGPPGKAVSANGLTIPFLNEGSIQGGNDFTPAPF